MNINSITKTDFVCGYDDEPHFEMNGLVKPIDTKLNFHQELDMVCVRSQGSNYMTIYNIDNKCRKAEYIVSRTEAYLIPETMSTLYYNKKNYEIRSVADKPANCLFRLRKCARIHKDPSTGKDTVSKEGPVFWIYKMKDPRYLLVVNNTLDQCEYEDEYSMINYVRSNYSRSNYIVFDTYLGKPVMNVTKSTNLKFAFDNSHEGLLIIPDDINNNVEIYDYKRGITLYVSDEEHKYLRVVKDKVMFKSKVGDFGINVFMDFTQELNSPVMSFTSGYIKDAEPIKDNENNDNEEPASAKVAEVKTTKTPVESTNNDEPKGANVKEIIDKMVKDKLESLCKEGATDKNGKPLTSEINMARHILTYLSKDNNYTPQNKIAILSHIDEMLNI